MSYKIQHTVKQFQQDSHVPDGGRIQPKHVVAVAVYETENECCI
jgi:hypothetical protein